MFFKSDYLKFRLFLIFAFHSVQANETVSNVTEPQLIVDEPPVIINRAVVSPRSTVTDIADGMINLLGVNINVTADAKLRELKTKLEKVNTYVIDKEKYASLIMNEIRESNLTELNFFNALQETDDFDFLKKNDYKNLYLKLKEKLNRDDVMAMLVENNQTSGSLKKYAEESAEGDLNKMVDKFIGETPKDIHKFNISSVKTIYWDPEPEIRLNRDDFHDGRRLYKGTPTTIREFPFMVGVQVLGSFWCGGAIFWSDIVLTSAACLQIVHNNRFYRENARVVTVRVGSNHSLENGEVIEANEVYFHPSYDPRTLRNNIAIIRLSRHIHISYHTVPKAIMLSHKENNVPLNEKVTLLGWGAITASGKMPYTPMFLQRLLLPVYPNWYCKEVYGDNFMPTQMFCAGTATTGEGACDHDAGGPAIVDGRLYGIISFGPSVCGYRDAPTVFTHVGLYADWIETINATIPESARVFVPTTTTTTEAPTIPCKKSTYSPSSTRNRMFRILPMTGKAARSDSKVTDRLLAPRAEAMLDDKSPRHKDIKMKKN